MLVHGELGSGEASMAGRALEEGAEIELVPGLGPALRPHRDLAATARLARILRRYRPDIVHTHTAKAGFVGRAAALAALRPAPVIVHTFHGHVLEGYFGPVRNRFYRSLESALGRRSDCLIGVSQATVDDLVRLGVAPADRFRVVPLGLDLERFADLDESAGFELRRSLGIDEDEICLAFAGRLVPIKRVDLLMRGFALARDRTGRRLRLLVVGDGDLRVSLEQLAGELGIAESVHFLGYQSDLAPVASAAQIAVISSANEGTPVWLIEAGAAGVPAIASRVGGVPEVVSEGTGLLFESGDGEGFADVVIRLADDRELRERMGAAAREQALQRYSAERLVADISSLYEELLAATGRAASSARPTAG